MIKKFDKYISEGHLGRGLKASFGGDVRQEDKGLVVKVNGEYLNLPWSKEGTGSYKAMSGGELKDYDYKEDDVNAHFIYNDKQLTIEVYDKEIKMVDRLVFDDCTYSYSHTTTDKPKKHKRVELNEVVTEYMSIYSSVYVSGKLPDENNLFNSPGKYGSVHAAEIIFCDDCDFSNVTKFDGWFSGCSCLKYVNIDKLPFNKITSTGRMFYDCSNLKEITITGITDACKIFTGMFWRCGGLEKITFDNCNLKTNNSNAFGYMFDSCESLKTIEGLDLSECKGDYKISNMFCNCSSIKSIDLSSLKSQITLADNLFKGCSSLQTLDMSGLESTKLEDKASISNMFGGCNQLSKIILNDNWNTTNIKGCRFELPKIRNKFKRERINYKNKFDDYESE